MENLLILLLILVPLAGALAVGFVGRRSAAAGSIITTAVSAVLFGMVYWGYNLNIQGGVPSFSLDIGLPFNIALGADSLSIYLALITTVLWTLASLYAAEYITAKRTIFNAFLLLSLYGMLGITFAANLFTLLLFFEIFSVASAALVLHEGTKEAHRAAFQYLMISVVGSAAIILASAAIYALTGSLDLMGKGIHGLQGNPWTPALFWLLVGGFAIKAGIFPVHMWLPEAHPIAPSPASALLSGIMIKAGAYGVIRVVYGVFGMSLAREPYMCHLLLGLSLFTMIFGSLLAIAQKELKRMLAYSSIAQIGYVMLGISLLSYRGLAGGVLHIFNHALMKGALFMAAGVIIHQTGLRNLDDLSGIGKRLPLTMLAFTLAALSMIGVPPFVGFFSKWLLAMGALDARNSGFISENVAYGIIATIVISGLLNIVYYGPILIRAWLGSPAGAAAEHGHGGHGHVQNSGHGHGNHGGGHGSHGGGGSAAGNAEPSWVMLVPMLLLAFATIALGVYINVPYQLVNAAVKLQFF